MRTSRCGHPGASECDKVFAFPDMVSEDLGFLLHNLRYFAELYLGNRGGGQIHGVLGRDQGLEDNKQNVAEVAKDMESWPLAARLDSGLCCIV